MFSKISRGFFFVLLFSILWFQGAAQAPMLFFKDGVKEKRQSFYSNLTAHTIKENLSLPLNAESEDAWIDAFNAMILVKYRDSFTDGRLDVAAKFHSARSNDFNKAFIALVNSDYPGKYIRAVTAIFYSTEDDNRLLAMAANYILHTATTQELTLMRQRAGQELKKDPGNALLFQLLEQIKNRDADIKVPSLSAFFSADYLPGQVIVFSFQRHDRNFPGLAMVRKSDGNLLRNADSSYFSIGQLARSQSNMPGYISLGNTPQGIFRMDGFDTSKNYFIGPSANIQLTLPFEFKAGHFYRDSTLTDTVWALAQYKSLLPASFRNYAPMLESFYAGKAGRDEIIAHGSTIDGNFYKGKSYFPYTPTEGCLVTIEKWSDATGILLESGQQLLTEAVKTAGGPSGYLIVINIDDCRKAVSLTDITELLNLHN